MSAFHYRLGPEESANQVKRRYERWAAEEQRVAVERQRAAEEQRIAQERKWAAKAADDGYAAKALLATALVSYSGSEADHGTGPDSCSTDSSSSSSSDSSGGGGD
jgi:hypothetical protein